MVTTHIKIAFRNIAKYKFYSFINIFGLSIGMCGCLFILLFVVQELNFDKFHSNADSIYRVNLELAWEGTETKQSATPPPLAVTLEKEFPEVVASTHIHLQNDLIVKTNEKHFAEQVLAVDSNFFKVFSFALLEGDKSQVLKAPQSVVLTDRMARKYFGNKSPIGEVLFLGNSETPYKITGVLEGVPANSHFHFDFLTSILGNEEVQDNRENWSWPRLTTYIRLNPGASPESLDAKFPEMCTRVMGKPLEDWKNSGGSYRLFLQPITDIHLYSKGLLSTLGPIEDINNIYILSIVAFFIIVIASVNFMNLTTAKSVHRVKESSIKRVIGSDRKSLIVQFLTESMLFSLLSMFIALGLLFLLKTSFKSVFTNELDFSFIFSFQFLALMIFVTLFVGLLAGVYPAFYLTSFNIIDTLKGNVKAGMGSKALRNVLVVFQFMVSIGLMVCTFFVFNQLEFLKKQDVGFDKENVLVVTNINKRLGNNLGAFKESLLKHSQIKNVSFTNSFPGKEHKVIALKPQGSTQDIPIKSSFVDYNYIETLDIKIAKGRGFSLEMGSDMVNDDEAKAILVNEEAAKQVKGEIIGKSMMMNNYFNYEVVGVVKNYNFQSLKANIEPMAIFLSPFAADYVLINYQQNKAHQVINSVRETWTSFAPNAPFEFSFLDEYFNQLYRSEQRLSRIFTIFSGLAIFIACLGLFGLVSFMAEQRTKEVGIRKVFGASEFSIVLLFSKKFAKLVLIAFVIATPVTYLVMKTWLDGFAYKVTMYPHVFLIAGLISLVIAVLTVSVQSIKAASANPIDSIRN